MTAVTILSKTWLKINYRVRQIHVFLTFAVHTYKTFLMTYYIVNGLRHTTRFKFSFTYITPNNQIHSL